MHELISGPLVKRLSGMANNKSELDYCSREMFALTMLIRLGRITEQDVRSTFAAFQRLDRHNEGFISQKEIHGTMFGPSLDTMGGLLPKQRNDNATVFNESSNLLHPLTMSSNPIDRQKNYLSLSKVPEQALKRNESVWSGISEENWDDHQ